MQNEYEIKKQICDIGRRIYNRNMVVDLCGIQVYNEIRNNKNVQED